MTTLGSIHKVESFCRTCGRTINQYVDFNADGIIYRENTLTPTGWKHKNDQTFMCRTEYIEPDLDFPIRHFKTYTISSLETIELSVSVV